VTYRYGSSKEALLARLKRVEGQVRGIARMVEDDKYCVEILDQISAATAGLEKVGLHLLSDHIKGCVKDAVATDRGDAQVEELVGVVERFIKS
jgi:CsoR family transcriptional regulator, copper-sensing transcriptional repressor